MKHTKYRIILLTIPLCLSCSNKKQIQNSDIYYYYYFNKSSKLDGTTLSKVVLLDGEPFLYVLKEVFDIEQEDYSFYLSYHTKSETMMFEKHLGETNINYFISINDTYYDSASKRHKIKCFDLDLVNEFMNKYDYFYFYVPEINYDYFGRNADNFGIYCDNKKVSILNGALSNLHLYHVFPFKNNKLQLDDLQSLLDCYNESYNYNNITGFNDYFVEGMTEEQFLIKFRCLKDNMPIDK